MIVVTDNAEKALAARLELALKTDPHLRCIHFRLNDDFPGDRVRDRIVDEVRAQWPDSEGYIFMCRDGDIFILAPHITQKSFSLLLARLPSPDLPVPFGELAFLFELGFNGIAIQEELKKKIAAIAVLEAQRAEADRLKLQKSILEMPIDPALLATLSSRRRNRKRPEAMIVEDDPFTQRLVAKTLESTINVTGCASARDALEKYAALAPDIVFLDIDLPDVTGHDVLQRLHDIDRNAFIVMLSGNGHQDNILRAMKSGAKGFVGKPFARDKLLQYINKCLTKIERKERA